MKLAPMIMMLLIIQMTIVFYDQVYADDPCVGDCESTYSIESYGDDEAMLWKFVTDPTDWSTTDFVVFLTGIFFASAGAFAVGALLGYKGDIFLFSVLFTFFVGLGSVPMISLYGAIIREPGFWGCATIPCTTTTFIWLFTGGIFSVFYLLAVLQWLRTGNV